ncbi:MAG: endopeptidase La [Caldisericota bacterium]|nr:endopeptidase La [Caldisericota bacterium]
MKTGLKQSNKLPFIPLRNVVIFPYMVVPLFIGRTKSITAIDQAFGKDKMIIVASQKNGLVEDPDEDDIYNIGVKAEVLQLLKLPDGSYRVLIEGLQRVKIIKFVKSNELLEVRVDTIPDEEIEKAIHQDALMRLIADKFTAYIGFNKKMSQDILIGLSNIDDVGRFSDVVAANLNIGVKEKQQILSMSNPDERLKALAQILEREVTILEISKKIDEEVKSTIEKSQKEYFLRAKIKEIEKELGEFGKEAGEIGEYKKKMKGRKFPAYVKDRIEDELERLKKIPVLSPESAVLRNYLDWLLELPWNKRTQDKTNINEASKILNKNHYGLEDVKERVLEFLAVRQLTKSMKGPIICFVGPPGVGKTSLGKSIAEALGRKFVRMSLGGIRDEAEIRGHRRTYVGAMPGRIIQGVKQSGVKNPVFLLDEIDKVGADFRGDPTAALLEGLDPEQNNSFSDHYIELPFDLSEVLFITTANIIDTIPPALFDRMEIMSLPGYIDEEKLCIATEFIIPKQLKFHGLSKEDIKISKKAVLRIIGEYTREAGLRNLERSIMKIMRKVAKNKVEKHFKKVKITDKNLNEYLGVPIFAVGIKEKKSQIGVACGMVVTRAGGDIVFIEAIKMPGKGNLILTGQLGDVMKESAHAALSYVRAHAKELGAPKDFCDKYDVHIHVPEGAVPKEGPSAGIAIFTALISIAREKPINRNLAMTGEITLRGRVLPVGGVKEKVLGAYRAGIKTIILPKQNENDLKKIPKQVKEKLVFKFVDDVREVVGEVFE